MRHGDTSTGGTPADTRESNNGYSRRIALCGETATSGYRAFDGGEFWLIHVRVTTDTHGGLHYAEL
jgi:hypothetical protein